MKPKKYLILLYTLLIVWPLFSWDKPHEDLYILKKSVGDIQTTASDIVQSYGNSYKYSEIDAYGKMPNSKENDKILVYEYAGLKFMLYKNDAHKRSVLFFWEITGNNLLEGIELYIGMTKEETLAVYGKPTNYLQGDFNYSFEDGSSLTFEFLDNVLKSVYWYGLD